MSVPHVQDANKFEKIGDRLAWIRGFRSTIQRAYAEQHGINQSLYSQYESGKRRIPLWAAEQIANKQRVTLDFIYRGGIPGLPEVWKARLLDNPPKSDFLSPSDKD